MTVGLLAVRADAGPEIGIGHVMRCLALAQAWKELGGACLFVGEMPARLEARVRLEGFGVVKPNVNSLLPSEAATADVVVVDGYHLGAKTANAVVAAGRRVLWLDDDGTTEEVLADVLNQNLHGARELYPRARGRCWTGARFAMLRSEFLRRGRARRQPSARPKVVVSFGGADPRGLSMPVAQALRAAAPEVDVTVLLGPAAPDAVPPAGVEVLRDASNVAELLAQADLAVAAAGSTAWELAFLGTPMALACTAPNQARVVRGLVEAGAAVELAVEPELRLRPVVALLQQPDLRDMLRRRGQELVDGAGAARVAAALALSPLLLRECTDADAEVAFVLANDPETRRNSFHSAPIPWETHRAWFSRRLRSPQARTWLAEASPTDDGIVGLVRFELRDSHAEIGVTVAPEHRGRGLASKLITAGVRRLSAREDFDQVVALIRPENVASCAAFRRAGFASAGETTVAGAPARRFVWPPHATTISEGDAS